MVAQTYGDMQGYVDIGELKDRLLIAQGDDKYDNQLDRASEEATRLVDIILYYYTANLGDSDIRNPIYWKSEDGKIPDIIKDITGDFAASIVKRRMFPDEVKIRGEFIPPDNQELVLDSNGWYALAYKKLQTFIKSTYVKPKMVIIGSDPSTKFGYKIL